MKISIALTSIFILASASLSAAASAWSYTDATVTVQGKGEGVGSGKTEKFDPKNPVANELVLSPTDTLKIALTTTEGKKPAKPHQAVLMLAHPDGENLHSYELVVRDSGKAKLDLTHKDIPLEFLAAPSAHKASLIIASFGTSTPLHAPAFELLIKGDPDNPYIAPEPPERFEKKPEIHHVFKPEPESPPLIITLFFLALVLATLPALFYVWRRLGANLGHLSMAFGRAPVAHTLFAGSMLAMQGVFAMYYIKWNLFQLLPAAGVVGVVAYLSGSRALTEVQERRLAGMR